MIYDIRNNKSLQDIKDFNIKLSNCNPELIISNIEYIIYNKGILFGDKIEIQLSDDDQEIYDLFIYHQNKYIGNITCSNIQLNKQDVEIY